MNWDCDTLCQNVEVDLKNKTGIIVYDSFIPIKPGDIFADNVIKAAREAGFGKFDVKFNGNFIDPENVPDLFNEGDIVQIMKYDTAANEDEE